ncbi:MAG: tetratricopeptide repeat protein [Bacteroidales bacterium]|nr:tetratricopeptide repeat protein [Bacteroidales bacterium]
MKKDRFKNQRREVKSLVLNFEAMDKKGDSRYYDVDQLETIIDFYLETADHDMLEKSVQYSEKLFPDSTEIKLRRVHLLHLQERYDEALSILKQLEQLEPDDTDVLYALGMVYSALDQPRKAIQYYHKATVDGFELGIVYSNIADEYVKMDQRAEARNYYRKALRINPNDEHSIYQLANCYEADGLVEQWIKYFQRFIEDNPYSKTGWFCLGEAFVAEELYERAIDAYQYAIAIDAEYYYAYTQMASCQMALNKPDEAVAAMHEACNHTEDKATVYFQIGEIFRSQNNVQTAATYYRKAINEDSFFAEAWNALASCYGIMQDYSTAIDCSKRALRIDPESPSYLTTLALIYAEIGDHENADRFFNLAIPFYTDFEQGWLALADYKIMLEKYDDAIDILNKGLLNCELVLEFNKRLALCYYHTGRRNMLFNAVRACIYDNENGAFDLLGYCPALGYDIDVLSIINSHIQEKNK